MTPKQKKRQKRIIEDLTYLINKEKEKFGGGNKTLIEQFERKIEKVTDWIPKKKKKWENAIFVGIVDQKYGTKQKTKKPVEVVKEVGEVGTLDI
mgnify:CR=1 FL=1